MAALSFLTFILFMKAMVVIIFLTSWDLLSRTARGRVLAAPV